MAHGTWHLPGSGIEPMSRALSGGFFTNEPPGKPSIDILTVFILPVYKHRITFHVFVSSSVSSSVMSFSVNRSFISLVKFIPTYFILFDAVVSGIIFLIYFFKKFIVHMCVCTQSLTCVQLFATPWAVCCQTPLFMGLSSQECRSGLLFPPPEDLPDPGIKPSSPALQVDSLPLSHWGSPSFIPSLWRCSWFLCLFCVSTLLTFA